MNYILTDAISFLISRTYARMKNIFLKKLKKYCITPEQWVLLSKISEKEGISPTELSLVSLRDKPYTTRLIDKLEGNDLIFKEESQNDKRSSLIYLTKRGAEIKKEIIPIADEINEWLVENMDEKEVEKLKSLLHKMYGNIQSHS
ncbi:MULTISPECIES: MarR family winged helix-turn-helix transcriptional regulator [Pelosinus]|uniref:Regulatory protein MarR n=1 Tax=Pelosinus fermentans B4 TaxID=1149862 RepID=I9LE53_9FIRM|nr:MULTISPECIES: MarR family transcriptional regulator [Pelosinus]EIW18744.1 regulatory protein MarR [Pelosinus fermentans B4]EIW22046.1 transcriptional regulator, MarR family [Pelosinus fermentans A11]OAM95101.1 transcriptional regulator, MarR family [Pelosinus fermentans DSM 17108]SDR23334.1 DNA-binding transcriptional regulator, MarR family [Pelosinus fermentans]